MSTSRLTGSLLQLGLTLRSGCCCCTTTTTTTWQVPSLAPGQVLPAFDLSRRGHLVRIDGYAFTAGKVRPDVAQRMAASATNDIRQALKNPATSFGSHASAAAAGAPIKPTANSDAQLPGNGAIVSSSSRAEEAVPSVVLDIQTIQEPPERAVGDGGGIVLIATTSTGCLIGELLPSHSRR